MGDAYVTVQKSDININVDLLSPRDYSTPFTDVRDYSSFSAAIDAIGASKKTLLIPNEQAVAADKTVPSNVMLMFLQGGSLNIAVTKTVTINGCIDAGRHQIFEGSGLVSVGVKASNGVYPEWWGAVTDNSTDCQPGIQAAITAVATSGSVSLGIGQYKINSGINLAEHVDLIGSQKYETKIECGNFADFAITLTDIDYCQVKDLLIDGNNEANVLGGIKNHGSSSDVHGNRFDRVSVIAMANAAAIGFYSINAYFQLCSQCHAYMGSGATPQGAAGFKTENIDKASTELIFLNCLSQHTKRGFYFTQSGVATQYPMGVQVLGGTTSNCTDACYEIDGELKGIEINGCNIERGSGATDDPKRGIYIHPSASGDVECVRIVNNFFWKVGKTTWDASYGGAICASNVNGLYIDSNVFDGDGATGCTVTNIATSCNDVLYTDRNYHRNRYDVFAHDVDPRVSRTSTYLNSAQDNLTSGNWHTVNLDAENYDKKSEFDAAADYDFTAKKTGKYQINAQVMFANVIADKYIAIRIRRTSNNTTLATSLNPSSGYVAYHAVLLSAVVELTKGDVIEVQVEHIAGVDTVDLVTGATNTYFNIYEVLGE